jgi:hypothetical protein
MKSIFSLSVLLLMTLQSFSQSDSLIAKNRRFISVGLELQTNRSNANDPNNSQDPSDYNSLGGTVKFSSGKFKNKGIARIFTVSVGKSGGKYQSVYSTSNSLTQNLAFEYAFEKYIMMSSKFGIFGGISGGLFYSYSSQITRPIETIIPNNIQNEIYLEQFNSVGSSSVEFKAYTGLTYFINSKWALSAIFGNIDLINIGQNRNYYEYKTLKPNNDISYYSDSSVGNRYNFSPSFRFSNSGFSVKYFLK